jgi:LCP family protein required for cell wall assembly
VTARPLSEGGEPGLPRSGSAASRTFAAFLSTLLPGLGQVYQERWVRGALMLLVPPLLLSLLGAFVFVADPIVAVIVRQGALFALLIVGGLFAYHVTIVGDAFAGRLGWGGFRGRPVFDHALLFAVVFGLSLMYYGLYRQSASWAGLLATVFQPAGRTIGVGTSSTDTTAPGWSGRERLNVLLLGIDTREESAETQNTDTVIVLSLDPVSNTAAMLSIPRDTLVDIPDIGQDKVNSAYSHGGSRRGAELARRTVERFLGIPIHSYAIIDFPAFRQTIDSVGGVVVDVRRPLRDEDYPTPDFGIERVRFLEGPQLMTGEDALRYARSRHDSNDFSRARRQQAVLFALRTRFAQAGLFRLPGIVQRVGPLVRTSFDPGNVISLARTALGIEPSRIRSEVLLPCNIDVPHCELTEESGPSGYYLIPDEDKVRSLVDDVFSGSRRTAAP